MTADGGYSTIDLRDAIASGLIIGPRMLAASHMISARGGHGDFSASIAPDVGGGVHEVLGHRPADVRPLVADRPEHLDVLDGVELPRRVDRHHVAHAGLGAAAGREWNAASCALSASLSACWVLSTSASKFGCGTLASRHAEITGSEVRMYRSRAEDDEGCAAGHLLQGRTVVEVKAPHLGPPGRRRPFVGRQGIGLSWVTTKWWVRVRR
ncbi:hypothetical protein ACFQMH_01755 [Streptomyces viridiviolaceus]|uniref:Uncharacterized protein n=1 Tax=Streptomyces viridiviolaceus TaxID=68282 RepID=A0ABW2DVH9_9ACTN|nr:hypothetical protein [Streptomyces viridiviolaceus]